MPFAVSLSNTADQTITVPYATADGSAIAGQDYAARSGTLTFTPGLGTLLVTVPLTGDSVPEPDETFSLNLGTPTGALLMESQGVATIQNDDLPTLSINDATVTEGSAQDWLSDRTGALAGENLVSKFGWKTVRRRWYAAKVETSSSAIRVSGGGSRAIWNVSW